MKSILSKIDNKSNETNSGFNQIALRFIILIDRTQEIKTNYPHENTNQQGKATCRSNPNTRKTQPIMQQRNQSASAELWAKAFKFSLSEIITPIRYDYLTTVSQRCGNGRATGFYLVG